MATISKFRNTVKTNITCKHSDVLLLMGYILPYYNFFISTTCDLLYIAKGDHLYQARAKRGRPQGGCAERGLFTN